MIGKCALYDTETELKQSHIVPKFAFHYMKKTGGKYLRIYERPNQRLQDGPKKYLLCEKAELDFSKREGWFVREIFTPYLKDQKKEFLYDENFAYFTISVLWRTLTEQLSHSEIKENPKYFVLPDVAGEWKDFLAKGIYPKNYNDLNVFLTDSVSWHNTNGINVDLYLSRYIDATIISNDKGTKIGVYVKFLRFIFWSVVEGEPNKELATKINFMKGVLSVPQKVRDDFFGSFLQNRIKEIDTMPKPSAAQEKIIIDEVAKNEADFWASDAGRAMISDFNNYNTG